ncbi:hypothetical protein [Jiangella asiatica]|nr:hypothetical protein [Jiangella asiatica]
MTGQAAVDQQLSDAGGGDPMTPASPALIVLAAGTDAGQCADGVCDL